MESIRVAIAGVGNCASSLLQGIEFYRNRSAKDSLGLMHWDIGGYKPSDISVVAAFDIDRRKVGKDLAEAVWSPPNCTMHFCDNVQSTGVRVRMGRVLDGISDHMNEYHESLTFLRSEEPEPEKEEVVRVLRDAKAQIVLTYLPVGSEEATRFYAECALDAGLGLINNIPVFIASDPTWGNRFAERHLPIIGDDIKSQLGATIVHRSLADLFRKRGVKLDRTYQLNTGGNTDFLNMLDRNRLSSKKESKTKAVLSVAGDDIRIDNIHVGPSDYVPWQKDRKVCFIRMEGRIFGHAPVELELRLSVEDSPNSAGAVIDAIRCCKLALDRGECGVLYGPSAYLMKHPPRQYPDEEAYRMTEEFIKRAEKPANPNSLPKELDRE
ncbi:MAG: inositol-3-phosphate synthase [Deltaproteobacteria bacterium]